MRRIFVPLEGVEFGRHIVDQPHHPATGQLLDDEGNRLLGSPFSIDFGWANTFITKPTVLGASAQEHSRALYETRFELDELHADGEISSLTLSNGITVRFVDLAKAITRFRYDQSIERIKEANAMRMLNPEVEIQSSAPQLGIDL